MSNFSRRDVLKLGAAASLAPITRYADAFIAKDDSFNFSFFSDTHVGLKNNIKECGEMFAEMKTRPIDFAINGGDVTDYGWAGEYDNYQAILKDFGLPVYHTAGNHDVRWSPQGVKIFRERLNAPHSYFEHKGVHFLLLDSTVPLSHWGHYEAEQLRWLAETLKKIGRSAPVFVVTHHWVGRDQVMIDNEEELRKILEPYNVKILFNGHGHSDLLWNWDGIVNTMNKGLYQGSWEFVEVDRAKSEIRMSRRTTQRPKQHLLSTVPLAADRGKRAVWATGSLPLTAAYDAARSGQIRVCYRAWEDIENVPSLAMLLGRAAGQQIVEIRDPKSGLQSTYLVDTPPPSRLRKIWQSKLTGGVMSHVKIVGDRIYVSAMDGSVSCLNKTNGRQVWRAKTGAYCHSSPVIDGDQLFVGSADANFYALDVHSGKELWRLQTEGPVYASAAVAQGVVCIVSGDGHFYGLDRKSGQKLWVYEMPKSNTAFAQTHATTDGDRFFIGAWDSHVYAIDVKTGSMIWRKPCFERTFAWSPAIGGPCYADGRVYVPANGNGLFCFDAKSGDQRWLVSSKTDKFGHSSPRIENGRIYVGGLGDLGEVRCHSAETGETLWVSGTGSIIYDSSPAIGENFVAIGSVGSLLSILDKEDGKIVAQTRLPLGHFLASPAAEGNRVYAGSYSNTVAAFEVV
ncbi:MAG: PQQ-binding-like beta-propeller repeat protein [Armatimonadetes bacterium]|nr:PQQ-binding-like beta-propeller repeat protein [Armatimonadota bacterium]